MRKISIAILAILYIVVSSGVIINVHYCMGKFAYADLYHQKDECGKCGMKVKPGSCCKHELKIVKLSDTHKLSGSDISIFLPAVCLADDKRIFITDLPDSRCRPEFDGHSPPGSSPLYILHRVLRI